MIELTQEVADFIKTYKPLVIKTTEDTVITVKINYTEDADNSQVMEDLVFLEDTFDCKVVIMNQDCELVSITEKT